jgi:hypothetical protein
MFEASLDLGNFYKGFISHYSEMARPLYDLTKKNQQWHWEQAHEDVQQTQRHLLPTQSYGQPTTVNDSSLKQMPPIARLAEYSYKNLRMANTPLAFIRHPSMIQQNAMLSMTEN